MTNNMVETMIALTLLTAAGTLSAIGVVSLGVFLWNLLHGNCITTSPL